MSGSNASTRSRVVKVAAGLEATDRQVPVRDSRHEALGVLIGKWINEGHTVATAEVPSVPILTSDVYEWAPGGFFVIHSASGRIDPIDDVVGSVTECKGLEIPCPLEIDCPAVSTARSISIPAPVS